MIVCKKNEIILVNKAFRGTREHGIQFIWYEDEDTNQPRRSLLYEELAKDHNLNKACFQFQFKANLKNFQSDYWI